MKRMSRTVWPIAALGALLLFVSSAPLRAQEDEVKELYKKHCQICHAKDGSAQTKEGEKTKSVDWRDGKIWQKVDDATSKQIILEGKGKMKAYKDKVPAEQVDALLVYCKSLSQPAPAPGNEPAKSEPAAEAQK